MFRKSEKEIEKIVETAPARPFLPREKPIKTLIDFVERVNHLRTQITVEKRAIREYEGNIESLANGSWRIEKNCGEGYWCVTPDQDDEIMDNAVREMLNNHWKKSIERAKDMIHSCEDELDWLEAKMRMNPQTIGYVDYNFDVDKDHA